jgi:hypothetical protein
VPEEEPPHGIRNPPENVVMHLTDEQLRWIMSAAMASPDVLVQSRYYLASQHRWTAEHNARLCRDLETELLSRGQQFSVQHRSYAITSVISAVAFMESVVNEVFQDAAEYQTVSARERLDPLSTEDINRMGRFWTASGERYMSVLDKYQMALLLASKDQLDEGSNPYQNAKYLVTIRNNLVHFRPSTHQHGEQQRLERAVADKFPPNGLLATAKTPWFPAKCLGAGCAQWACETSRGWSQPVEAIELARRSVKTSAGVR